MTVSWPKGEDSEETNPAGTFILDFEYLGYEKIHFYCLNHPVSSILLWQLSRLRHHHTLGPPRSPLTSILVSNLFFQLFS